MMKITAVPILLVTGLAACAAAPEGSGSGTRSTRAATEEMPSLVASARAADASAPAQRRMGRDPLADLLSDPAYQRRFADSYLARTDVEPTVTEGERKQMIEVLELIGQDKLDAALAKIAKAKNAASSAVFDFTLGNVHFQRDELDEAAAAYAVAVEKYPKFLRAWQGLAQTRLRQQDFARALPALIRAFEEGGGDAVSYGMLGIAHANLGNPLAAESAFRMATLLDPQRVEWKKGLANSLHQQGRFAETAALCDALLAEHPDKPEFWLLQGNARSRLGEPLRAAENYEMADLLGGSSVDSLNNLAILYLQEGLFDMAVDAYARALGLTDDGPVDFAVRGAQALASRGAIEATRALVAEIEAARAGGLELEPRKDVLKLKARVALAAGASDEEAAILEDVVALDPLDGQAILLLGQHAARHGEPEKAVLHYERAAAMEAFEAEAKLRHGQLLVSSGDYAGALPLLRRSFDLKPSNPLQDYIEKIERYAQNR